MLKDYLTSEEPTPEEKKEFVRQVAEASKEILDNYAALDKTAKLITDGQSDNVVETKTLRISLPANMWKAMDSIQKIFDMRTSINIEAANEFIEKQSKVDQALDPTGTLTRTEKLFSQFALDTVMLIADQIVAAELMNEFKEALEEAIESGDEEKITALLTRFKDIKNGSKD